jgi:hypothetical protein
MQLADRVGRKYDGQLAAARPPRIPSLAAVTGVALPSRFQQPRLAFVRVYPYDRRPEFSISLPLTPNIYCQRQPWLTNNSQVFT